MLKLIYNVKYGFKQAYMTELDCEYDLSSLVAVYQDLAGQYPSENIYKPKNEEDLYTALFEGMTSAELEEKFTEDGTLSLIEDMTLEDASNISFYKQCHNDTGKKICWPGYCKIYGLRVVYDPSGEPVENRKLTDVMKASEVLAALRISRMTLSNYVKKGLVEIKPNPAGKQYLYSRESVMKLLKV